MADPAIAKYLSDNVGGVLAEAMAELAVAQPSDGVDFLAQWLKVYIDEEEAKGKRADEEAKLLEARRTTAAKREEQAAKKAAREQAAAAREAVYKDALAKFSDEQTVFAPELWQELLKAAAALTGAKAAYLGLVEEDGLEDEPGPLIRYTEALEGSEEMKERVLKQDEGVTWGAVTENPGEEVLFLHRFPQPEPVPDPEDPEAVVEPPPPPPFHPVSVPCVTDVEKVRYFELTRLGAYLAVPLVYNSSYTADALEAAKAFEEAKKARAEKQKAYDEAVEEAKAAGSEEPVEKDPILDEEEAPLSLEGKTKTVRMVLCLDTLGANELFDESKFEAAMELAKACGKCKENSEVQLVDSQALVEIDEAAQEKLKTQIEETRERWEKDGDLREEQESEAEGAEDIFKELVALKYDYLRAVKVLLDPRTNEANEELPPLKEELLKLKTWVVAKQEMMDLIAAVCFLYGMKKVDIYPKRKPNLNWQVLLEVLGDDLFERMSATDLTAQRTELEPEQKLAAIKALVPEDFDSEKCQAISPALEMLLNIYRAAVAYRERSLKARMEEYDRLKAEAEAAAAEAAEGQTVEMPEPPVDDDLEAA